MGALQASPDECVRDHSCGYTGRRARVFAFRLLRSVIGDSADYEPRTWSGPGGTSLDEAVSFHVDGPKSRVKAPDRIQEVAILMQKRTRGRPRVSDPGPANRAN